MNLYDLKLKTIATASAITPETLIILHFTILAIVVTLISIAGTLSKQVNYRLIVQYYLKSPLCYVFFTYLLLSFITSAVFVFYDLKYPIISLIVFGTLFLYSAIFGYLFITSLTLDCFCDKIITKAVKNKHSRDDALKDFLLNLKTFYKKKITETEENTILKLLEMVFESKDIESSNDLWGFEYRVSDIIAAIEHKSYHQVGKIFRNILDNSIQTNKNFVPYHSFIEDLVIRWLEESRDTLDKELNLYGYYLNSINSQLRKKVKKTESLDEVYATCSLLEKKQKALVNLCKYILSSFMNEEIRHIYFKGFFSGLYKSLNEFKYLQPEDFYEDYSQVHSKVYWAGKKGNTLNVDAQSMKKYELTKKKIEFINVLRKDLEKQKLIFMYMIMDKISKEELPKSFFQFAKSVITEKSEAYYEYPDFSEFYGYDYDDVKGGSQFTGNFNYEKYRILILLNKFISTKDSKYKYVQSEVSRFKKFDQCEKSMKQALEELNTEQIEKYFNCSEKDLSYFKAITLINIKEKLALDLQEVSEEITKIELGDTVKDKLKESFAKEWEVQQKYFDTCFIQVVKNKNIITDNSSYLPLQKELIYYINDNEEIKSQGIELFKYNYLHWKKNRVFYLINSLFNKKSDVDIHAKDLDIQLKPHIEPKKEYLLLLSRKDIDLEFTLKKYRYDDSKKYVEGVCDYNNSKIWLVYTSLDTSLLYEEGTFKINQHNLIEPENEEYFKCLFPDDINYRTKEDHDNDRFIHIELRENFEVERIDNKKRLIRISKL